LRLEGGAGSAAARAKKRSMMLVVDEDSKPGSAMPCLLSTHVPHVAPQLGCSWSACSGPRCSTHPGQLQSTPHVQPEPARDSISLIGGMKGKSGTSGVCAGESSENRNGGSSGGGWLCSVRCFSRWGEPLPCQVGSLSRARGVLQQATAAFARVSRSEESLPFLEEAIVPSELRQEHCHKFLQLQGFKRESTSNTISQTMKPDEAGTHPAAVHLEDY